jgi:hypothetical protein
MLPRGPHCVFVLFRECVLCWLKAVRNELWVPYWNNYRLDIHTSKFCSQK